MDQDDRSTPEPIPLLRVRDAANQAQVQREIAALKARVQKEASTAVGMLESACEALFKLDEPAARGVMVIDDQVDTEEVHIEEEGLRILVLFQPYARDFRTITALLRVNADLERLADHATSIAKLTLKLKALGVAAFPTSLIELGQRVPMQCHALLTSLGSEDAESARSVIRADITIDTLDKRLFDECIAVIGHTHESKAAALLMYRCGRELERVGDLAGAIAEDLIYIAGGAIVRHKEKRRLKGKPPK
jgi:phosphate transport system protein